MTFSPEDEMKMFVENSNLKPAEFYLNDKCQNNGKYATKYVRKVNRSM